jgi:hypothetical protein
LPPQLGQIPARIDEDGETHMDTNTKRAVASLLGGATVALAASLLLASPASADKFTVCPSGMSGVSTDDTSCAFADNVRWGLGIASLEPS